LKQLNRLRRHRRVYGAALSSALRTDNPQRAKIHRFN
jgi:hypothetical protein